MNCNCAESERKVVVRSEKRDINASANEPGKYDATLSTKTDEEDELFIIR